MSDDRAIEQMNDMRAKRLEKSFWKSIRIRYWKIRKKKNHTDNDYDIELLLNTVQILKSEIDKLKQDVLDAFREGLRHGSEREERAKQKRISKVISPELGDNKPDNVKCKDCKFYRKDTTCMVGINNHNDKVWKRCNYYSKVEA